jgi:hypothetical protein
MDYEVRLFFMSDIVIISVISMAVVSNAFVFCAALHFLYKFPQSV